MLLREKKAKLIKNKNIIMINPKKIYKKKSKKKNKYYKKIIIRQSKQMKEAL